MENLIIFGAKYLVFASPIITAIYIWKAPQVSRNKILVFLLISLPLTYVLGVAARSVHDNPRPFVLGNFEPLVAHEADNGFPSDHVLLVGALAAALTLFSRRLGVWLWTITILVAASRVVAGVHHTADVIGSAIIALIVALVLNLYLKKRRDGTINS